MRKGIKISAKVLSGLILAAIFLPLCLSLLLSLEPVQNYVVDRAARAASNRLGVEVRIGRIGIGFFNRIELNDLYVEDYQHDTLLYAGRLSASIQSLGLFGGGIVLRDAHLSKALFALRETPEGVMNVKQVVDRISPRKGDQGGKFRLEFGSLHTDSLEFRLQRNDDRQRPYGIDWADMRLRNIAAQLTDLVIDGPAIGGHIDRLSATERSGFFLEDMRGRFYVINGGIGVTDARILTPHSDLSLATLLLIGDSWAGYKDFIGHVQIDGRIERSRLASDDVAYFAPALRTWHTSIDDLQLDFSGTVDRFEVRGLRFDAAQDTRLDADLKMRGLPEIAGAHLEADIRRLRSNASDAALLMQSIARKELPEKLRTLLGRAGTVDLTGRFVGTLDDFEAQALAATATGTVDARFKTARSAPGKRNLKGALSTRNFRLGELLGQQAFGRITLTASIDGPVGGEATDAAIEGDIDLFEMRGVSYDSLRVDGRLLDREFDGRIRSRDDKLDFDFDGLVDLRGEAPHYDFRLDLRRADLHAMRLNLRDTISLLSARVDACVSGRSLDDMDGQIGLNDVSYRYNGTSIDSVDLLLTGHNTPTSKRIDLRSDLADLTFRSRRGYREAFAYLRNSLRSYLPQLYRQEALPEAARQGIAEADDYSSLTLLVKHFNPVADAISDGLQIADSTQLNLLFNPASRQLSLRLRSDYIERNRMLATKLSLTAMSRGDSLVMHGSAEDLYSGGLHLRALAVTGGARNDRFVATAGFADTATRFSGQIGVLGAVSRSEEGQHVIDLHFTPSRITQGNESWQIMTRRITIAPARIQIDRFRISNDRQQLLVDGVASRSRNDSVTLDLRNFKLSPLTHFVANMGYRIEGRSNGYAIVKSALHESEITADIRLDSLQANGLQAPPLNLLSRWDFEKNRAGVLLIDRQRRDTLVRGFYVPSQGRYFARAELDSLSLALLDPILVGVISSTRGTADARLTLTGQRRDARLQGQIDVRGLSTTVDFTQVTYSIPQATITVDDNLLTARRTRVFDAEGHSGALDFTLDLNHLSNIAYRLDLAPEQMLVLNTTRQDNDLFYGRVYASGAARISGDKGGVTMDIAAATDDNSSFFMPLSGKANVAKADFVIFESTDKPDTTDYLVRKKLMFERRLKQRSKTAGAMDINLALDVRTNTEIQLLIDPAAGDVMRGRGQGRLNLHINPRTDVFEMYGDYVVSEGSYQFSLQNIINKKFLIESGSSIQWTGEPLDAILDIDAVYKLRASLQPLLGEGTANTRPVPVECVIHLGDRLSNPSKSFSILLPNADSETQTALANIVNTETSIARQFIYLLLFNSFYPEASTGASSNIGAVASAATGIELLTNQLSNILSGDNYDIFLRYRPKTETESDEVDVGFSAGLIENRLLIEAEGNYLIDNRMAVSNQLSSFMGEASLTWLIDRAGTLRLRVFTHTIDRFDETQGLQQNGIGIYYKEDFNNLKDLRQRLRDRFGRRERKKRRDARRALSEEVAPETSEDRDDEPPLQESGDERP